MNSKELKAEAEELSRDAGSVPLSGEVSVAMFKKCYVLQYRAYKRMLRAYNKLESEKQEVK